MFAQLTNAEFSDWVPALLVAALTFVTIAAVRWYLRRKSGTDQADVAFRSQLGTAAVVLVGLLAIIFVLPEGSDSDLAFSVFGLIVTGALAISSQSIIANAMAGLILRTTSSFKPGDFIEVAEQMGRVTERGLFHTEIQTADRDLVTLPNAIMVNQPVRVVRASGTIVSANASIGYDVSRHLLEELFVSAAEKAGLIEPFVQVVELGDYTVNYRIAGFLEDPRTLLGTRSKLRGAILDTLHGADIEIMSPMFIARREAGDDPAIPEAESGRLARSRRTAESRVFDKADAVAQIEETKTKLVDAEENLEILRLEVTNKDPEIAERAQRAVERAERTVEILESRITSLTDAAQQD